MMRIVRNCNNTDASEYSFVGRSMLFPDATRLRLNDLDVSEAMVTT